MQMSISKTYKKTIPVGDRYISRSTTISKTIDPETVEEFLSENDKLAEQARLTTERDIEVAIAAEKK